MKQKREQLENQFALSIEANSVHGSDSAETAIEEINYFFDSSRFSKYLFTNLALISSS